MKTKVQGSPCLLGTRGEGCVGCVRPIYIGCTVTNNCYSISMEDMQVILDMYKEQQAASGHTAKSSGVAGHAAAKSPVEKNIREELIRYVLRARPHLAKDWRSRFEKDWNAILDMKVVSDAVYRVGKQRGTNFNRNLVANILFYMERHGAYGNHYNATTMAILLESSGAHSVRAELRKAPPPAIVSRLDRYFE